MPHAEKSQMPMPDTTPRRIAVEPVRSARADDIQDSPRMVAQRQLLKNLFGDAQPVQREVKKSAAKWGQSVGKWVTTLDAFKSFDTQEQAQAREDEVLEEQEQLRLAQEQAREDAWVLKAKADAWEFPDGAGRLTEHFNDGWGASYGITSVNQLRDYILGQVDRDGEAVGKYGLDLGECTNLKEDSDEYGKARPCTILYDVIEKTTITVGSLSRETAKRRVFHCGPSSG